MYAKNRTVDEVIKRLTDRIIQQVATIKKAFLPTTSNHMGKLVNLACGR